MKVLQLGAGMVGRAIAYDLAGEATVKVTVADFCEEALQKTAALVPVETVHADLSDPGRLVQLAQEADLVIGALPGHMGYQVLRHLISAGKNVVDISFFPEDPFSLQELAKEKGVTAVVDCGVAPGTSNLLAGFAASHLEHIEEVAIYVGGLPVQRFQPFEYRAPFSPVDVIEEYTRPARLVECGRLVVKSALSDLEELEIPGVGTLEAFNTDGLRTLLHTLRADFMREKTLRYPGHAEKIRFLREVGFFSRKRLAVDGQEISPLHLTEKLLFRHWRFRPGEEDLTVMRVSVVGSKQGRRIRYRYDLLDRADPGTGLSSMARCTGFMASVTARQILQGNLQQKGILPPEFLGRNAELFSAIFSGLKSRGLEYRESVEVLEE